MATRRKHRSCTYSVHFLTGTKERMERALEQLKTIPEQDYAKVKALTAVVKPPTKR